MSTINHIYLSALVDFKIRPTTHQMNNIEWSCDLVNLAHDVGQSATSWRQAQQQLITHEEKFFTDYGALHGQSTSTTKPVDVDQVLGTSGVSGLQCPKCGSYALGAKRMSTFSFGDCDCDGVEILTDFASKTFIEAMKFSWNILRHDVTLCKE